MARANLVVEQDLLDLFVDASKQSPPIRWIKAVLSDVTIGLVKHGKSSGDASSDLETMKKSALDGSSPCFVLFCLEEKSDKGWVLIAFVPDNAKVRDRMLYASGQDDVKRAMGFSNFSGSSHVTEASELTMESLRGVRKRDLSDAPLTESELLAKEEVAQMAAPSEARANAMGMVPFKFTDDFNDKVREFAAGSRNLVEAMVKGDDTIALGTATSGDALTSSNICTDSPRFYLVRSKESSKVYYVFSCPEGSKIRVRMTYSTAKATLAHHLSEMGVEICKVLEVGEPSDFDETLRLHDTPDETQGKIVQQNFSKPSRPGRGKARIVKKK